MILYIDTSKTEKVIVGFDDERFETDARDKKAQMLLPFLDKLLKKKKKKLTDIKEIKINSGPGSYTGLRIGVSIANTVGWILGVPVNGKDLRKGEVVDIKYE